MSMITDAVELGRAAQREGLPRKPVMHLAFRRIAERVPAGVQDALVAAWLRGYDWQGRSNAMAEIKIRLRPAEKGDIEAAAARADESVSRFVKDAIREKIARLRRGEDMTIDEWCERAAKKKGGE